MLENKKLFPVEKMCYCLKVSKNAYYHWLKVKDTPMLETTTTFLKARILALFKESRETYGSLRLNKMLEREKLYYSRSYVAVLMRELGLRSVFKEEICYYYGFKSLIYNC
jgi:putative transposase